TGVTLADVSGDGLADVLLTNNASPGKLVVLVNQSALGTTTFATAATYQVDGTPAGLAVGDTNQDGFLDVVTANSTSNDVSLLVGNGDGTFRLATNLAVSGTNPGPDAVATGDLNGDGLADLVVANRNTNTVS